jgi:hypothetical protein
VPQWLHDWNLDGNAALLDVGQLLIVLFAGLLIACGVGAALQSRRRHPRFLAAVVAPWALMPNVLCQMMCRYQIWGAVLSALLIGIGSGMALLHILMTCLCTGMILNQLLPNDLSRSPQLHQFVTNFAPDDGWLMLGAAAIILFVALTPGSTAPNQDLSHGSGRSEKS